MSNDELSLDDMRSALAKWLAGLDGRQQNKRNIAGLLEAAFQRIDALKTRVEVLDVAFANSHQLNESLGDENRALLARVEAAEAEAARLRDENAEAWFAFYRQQSRGDRLAARVAELEAQLAAQQWRPVTEKPEPDQKVEIIIEATFDGYGRKGWTTGGFYFNADFPTGWRPLPPAPQETE